MVALLHPSCSLCLERDSSRQIGEMMDAGPSAVRVIPTISIRSRRIQRRRRLGKYLYLGLVAATTLASPSLLSTATAQMQSRNIIPNSIARGIASESTPPPSSLSNLLRKREKSKRQYGPNQDLNFEVNVTPPKTCTPMNITFDPRKGSPPFTIFIGFSQWFPFTVQLPSTYADPGLSSWFYQFDVPVFQPSTEMSPPNPLSVVVVSDSTGNLMNSSSFQTVTEEDTSCAQVQKTGSFIFYNDPLITACNPMAINWSYNATIQKDPMDIYLLREMAPPIHIPITNSSAMTLNYTVALKPGTNIMLSITDFGGNGGVSGQNTVGGSEYIGQACLADSSSSILSIAIPSPTTTLSNLRMPDYTAMISSTLTSNGVVSTQVAVETYRHGTSFSDSSLGKGSIAGLAVGIALGAAILAAIVSWCVWRRKSGRRTMLWDVPRSVEGELSKLDTSGPIDENFLRNRSKAMSRNGSAGLPMLPPTLSSPTSDSSEDRDRNHRRNRPPFTSSETSFADSQADSSPLRLHHSPPWTSHRNSQRYSNLAIGLNNYSDVPMNEGSNQMSGSGGGGGGVAMARRGSESSSIASNPFGNSHSVSNASRSHRQPFADLSGGGDSEGESLAMTDTRFHSSARLYSDNSPASLYEPDYRAFGSSRSSLPRTSNHNPTYLQHSDAGLLMDDTLDEEDLGDQIELPPQYDAVPRRAAAATRPTTNSSSQARNGGTEEERDLAGSGTLRSTAGGTDEDGDESQFWRSPPSNHHTSP